MSELGSWMAPPMQPGVSGVDAKDQKHEGNKKPPRRGCYVHIEKERLLGIYLSVFVYKGCEHLVQGVDKDFVTCGLVGGRVGNKGGVGISLKLADHRLLFVNSHLTAHTDRILTRLENIAKIKAELKLDCFLPDNNERSRLSGESRFHYVSLISDITDRFDTTFWFGDMNFRLEISREHAEWLIAKKDYAQALSWDQLKKIMKDDHRNPFPGFEEALIDFAPTFKVRSQLFCRGLSCSTTFGSQLKRQIEMSGAA